jgi:hypothetical protein
MMMSTENPMCCGGRCLRATGEVRVYPLGGGGNLILCRDCWRHENAYRRECGAHYGRPEEWPQLDWNAAKVYP